MSRPKDAITRYKTISRLNHWLTGLCFVLLLLSGLAMFHPYFFFLSFLFGGGQWMRAIHPWIGVALIISFAGLFIQFWHHNLWEKRDTEWVKNIDKLLAHKEDEMPEVGRNNAGQKGVFWGMSLLVPVLFLSGLVIWEIYFGHATSIPVQRIALLIHSAAAIGAILIWIVHVYAAIWIKDSMRAMTRGWVTPGWARKHHRQWFRELIATGSSGPEADSKHGKHAP
jgi:formate dehydrogenase subunit gamma